MSNVHACERLLPVVGQFATEQIHQQPVREAAVAATPVLPPRADGAEARPGIAADRLTAGGRRVNRDPVVTALPVQRSSVWLPVQRFSVWLAELCPASLLPGCLRAPGPTSLAERRPRGPGSILSAFAQQAGRHRDRPPIGLAPARQL